MTQLIVTPIDMSAPGSFVQRKKLLQAAHALQEAQKTGDIDAMLRGYELIEGLVREHLETDDGTSVEDALEMCSANDFDALIGALVTGETVPNPSSAS